MKQSPLLRAGAISFRAYPLEEAWRRISRLGFDGAEVAKPQLSECKTPELLKQFVEFADDIGVRVCALNNTGGDYFRPFDSKRSLEGTIQGLKDDVDLCRLLSLRDLMVWEGVKPKGGKKDETELLRTTTRVFREAVAYASRYGVRIYVEPHPFTLGMDIDFLMKLCDSLDSKHFGVLYDSCHYGVGKPKEYIEAVRILGERIKHIHFADSDQRSSELHYPLGRGKLDLDGIISAFSEIGYSGGISLDTYLYPLPEEAAKVGMPKLKEAIHRLGLD